MHVRLACMRVLLLLFQVLLPYKEQCEQLKQERAVLEQPRAALERQETLGEIEQEEATHRVKGELRAGRADPQLQRQRKGLEVQRDAPAYPAAAAGEEGR